MLKLKRTTGADQNYGFLSRSFKRLLAASVICLLVIDSVALAVGPPPLSQIPVPEPPDLARFVKSRSAAIQLGKALFWDMQVGSDGVQACASCHYRAGADPVAANPAFTGFTSHKRIRNRLNPGPDAIFGNNSTVIRTSDPLTLQQVVLRAAGNPQFGPVHTLQSGDFPLFRLSPVNARLTGDPLTGLTSDAVSSLADTNDVVGSPGIRLADFLAINAGSELEAATFAADPLFTDGAGNNLRRVTRRKAPSVINAVFNYTNFWDGRASNIFNGENPYGPLDQAAGIWADNGTALVKQPVAIRNASLASQATGQALGDEMSYRGRTFPELGRKLFTLTVPPLGKQLVHPNDSVLGPLARGNIQPDGTVTGNGGLNSSYSQMVRNAFDDALWNSPRTVNLPTVANPGPTGEPFSQMEANFSLFFGLAIQLYEATLVSDRTPFDRFQAGNLNALSVSAQRGLNTFISKCATCHTGSELTSAATGSRVAASTPVAFTNNTTHSLITANANPTTLVVKLGDAGFSNTGVRPTADDIGRGGTAPSGYPLSFTRLAGIGGLPFSTPQLPPITATQPDAVNGSFKVPGLRNVELTPPYFHNGDSQSLGQVVEFYARGGNFPSNPELSPTMQPIGNLRKDPVGQFELVEFLTTLTDDRVRNETAPFDHPQLLIPHGTPEDLSDPATIITIPPTGGAPAPVAPGLTLNPVVSPAIQTSQVIGGTVDPAATVAVSLNGQPPFFATVSGVAWSATVSGLSVGPPNIVTVTATTPTGGSGTQSATINVLPSATIAGAPTGVTSHTFATLSIGGPGIVSYQYKLDRGAFSADIPVATPLALNGLADGIHTVSVLGRDALGNQQPAGSPSTAFWSVKATPPLLTVDSVATPTIMASQTIGGTVEAGVVPSVSADTGVTIGPVSIIGSSWSCLLAGLGKGTTTLTVTAVDSVFNTTVKTVAIALVTPDGNLKGSGAADISDAFRALRIAAGIIAPTAADLFHGDVAPLVNGVPAPDGSIDVSDALVILRKVVGLASF